MAETNKVRAYRVMIGYTQEEMAKEMGVSVNTYRSLEENPARFKIEQANKLIELINKVDSSITLSDIFS